jgi:multidrug resistance efflux pump
MDRLPSLDPRTDRIAHATARVNVAMARVSQAEEALMEAKERLARARVALEHAKSQDPYESPTGGHPLQATDTAWRQRPHELDHPLVRGRARRHRGHARAWTALRDRAC